jgi:hypothetical protein
MRRRNWRREFKENRETAVRSTVSPTSNGSIFTGGEELNPTMYLSLLKTNSPIQHEHLYGVRLTNWGETAGA